MSSLPGLMIPLEHRQMGLVDAVLLDGVMHAAYVATSNPTRVVYYLYCERESRATNYADNPQFFELEASVTCFECLAVL